MAEESDLATFDKAAEMAARGWNVERSTDSSCTPVAAHQGNECKKMAGSFPAVIFKARKASTKGHCHAHQ
eukprot:m.48446 g.48446  ORF g.48446 m.48446 type:complete len:70 (-) comp6423_c0_seq1:1380-1589(-)